MDLIHSGASFITSHSRLIFLLALVWIHAAAWFGARKHFAAHGLLMLSATGSVAVLFVAGIVARGLMGSVGKVAHGPLFYAALGVHILSGAIFLLLAGFLVLPSGIGNYKINSEGWLARKHRNFGSWAVRAITVSVLCLVVM